MEEAHDCRMEIGDGPENVNRENGGDCEGEMGVPQRKGKMRLQTTKKSENKQINGQTTRGNGDDQIKNERKKNEDERKMKETNKRRQ